MFVSLFLDLIMRINLSLDPNSAYSLCIPPLIRAIDVSPLMADCTSPKMFDSMKLGFPITFTKSKPSSLSSHGVTLSLFHSCLHLFLLPFLCLNILLLPLSNLLFTLPLPGLRLLPVPHLNLLLQSLSSLPHFSI